MPVWKNARQLVKTSYITISIYHSCQYHYEVNLLGQSEREVRHPVFHEEYQNLVLQ